MAPKRRGPALHTHLIAGALRDRLQSVSSATKPAFVRCRGMRDRQLATRRQSLALLFGVLIDASCKAQKASTPAAPVLGTSLADPTARRFYQLRGGSPAWDAGKAQSLEQAVAGAQAHGLDPAAFAPKPATNQDEGLTLCALAYARALA